MNAITRMVHEAVAAVQSDELGKLKAINTAQHTPGPWIRQQWPDGSHTITHGATLGTIATMFAGDDEREQADARLIAAAPELLAALEAEQEWREREEAGALDPEWDYERMVGDKRRAAIAKATGSAA